MLQYDFHTKIKLGGSIQLRLLQLGLVGSQTRSVLISKSLHVSTTQRRCLANIRYLATIRSREKHITTDHPTT
jgi:hypothetical protein